MSEELQILREKLALFRRERAITSDPSQKFSLIKKIEETEREIQALENASPAPPQPPAPPPPASEPPVSTNTSAAPTNPQPATTKKSVHVFLSHVKENRPEVRRLRAEILKEGHTVWWDQDLLPGQNWKHEIRKELKDARAFVLCLSKDFEKRVRNGAIPEIRDAIAIYREFAPGSVFIIPVRLEDCKIPSFEIDATLMLDDIQYVDLFPASEREYGLQRLFRTLESLGD